MVVGELAFEKDLVIIGGGPGGYHAAIRASQLGKNVTIIEKDDLGGVCLNKGCIPSKVFAFGAERLCAAKQDEMLGLYHNGTQFKYENLLAYKSKVIQQLRTGIEALCKANKVEIVKGSAFFLSEEKIGVESEERYEVYTFNHAIIATGGVPLNLEGVPDHHPRLLNTWSIAELPELPNHLIIVGSDYISLEMAMTFQGLGSKVTMILENESFPLDSSVNREISRILKKAGISVMKKSMLLDTVFSEKDVTISLSQNNGLKTISGSHLFFSLGTKPCIEQIGLDRIGIKMTNEGFILTDKTGRTSISSVYAIGDVTEGPQLAVKAIKQGKTAADAISGIPSENDLTYLPTLIRTRPPIACVGLTEQKALELGYDIGIGEFSFSANGYASILGKKDGLAKVVFEKGTDLLLGVHLIGEGAADLISGGVQALEMAARNEDLKFPMYAHPSLSEAMLEAVESYTGEAIHILPKKQKASFVK